MEKFHSLLLSERSVGSTELELFIECVQITCSVPCLLKFRWENNFFDKVLIPCVLAIRCVPTETKFGLNLTLNLNCSRLERLMSILNTPTGRVSIFTLDYIKLSILNLGNFLGKEQSHKLLKFDKKNEEKRFYHNYKIRCCSVVTFLK